MRPFGSIEPGWEVYGSDGGHIGTAHVVGDDYLEVEKGTFFIKDLFIPRSAVQGVDLDQHRVTLNVSRDAVGDMGWTEPPVTAPVPQSSDRETWGQGSIDDSGPAERREPDADLVGSGAGMAGGTGGRGIMSGAVDRSTSGRIEEDADELSTSRVPVERVDEETLELWSEPDTEETAVDDQPRLGG